jgi:hypothetical protein
MGEQLSWPAVLVPLGAFVAGDDLVAPGARPDRPFAYTARRLRDVENRRVSAGRWLPRGRAQVDLPTGVQVPAVEDQP